ncbi:major facilitator superfamily domain-containing protein [Roridomyces roridus]|uniref:Major facilitator superfamily domain-containing protein n=1 Tax=Roridomyces roridus TaxID=1738132 RepID=A0AAD7CA71_9AGAR|nr:major facilitator superfamily domain-containing protein [Roridomyces roridus]
MSTEQSNVKVYDHEGAPNSPAPEIGTPERVLAERKLVRKLDCRLMPAAFLIFIMNYVDRAAITTARLKGLEKDLGLSDLQYTIVLSALYATYCPAQLPATIASQFLLGCAPSDIYLDSESCNPAIVVYRHLCRPLGPRQYSYRRMALGIPEAAWYPGAMYLLSRWYTKKELGLRASILYIGQLISNAFGSLMAAGILSTMEGKRGIRGWRWLFFIEVSLVYTNLSAYQVGIGLYYNGDWDCCHVGFTELRMQYPGLYSWAEVSDSQPNNTPWIVGDERRLAEARLADDLSETEEDREAADSPLHGLKLAIRDPLMWAFTMMTLTQLLGQSFMIFFPTSAFHIVFMQYLTSSHQPDSDSRIFRYNHLAPCSAPMDFAAGRLLFPGMELRTEERFSHIGVAWWSAMLGFIISLSTNSVPARYLSMFLMAFAPAGSGSLPVVWLSNVIPRPLSYVNVPPGIFDVTADSETTLRKRAAAIGISSGVGNIGILIGSYTWRSEWSPFYHPSMIISLSALVLSSAIAFGIRRHLIRKNHQLDQDEKAAAGQGMTLAKGFRYLY